MLFYTWPLKYIALGELAVLIVWGPLMIGGGYYVITGAWDWWVVIASLPYALGVTGVIFGKHIDKYLPDKERRIHTLPVVIGEKAARVTLLGMLFLQYLFTFVLIATGFYTPLMLLVVLAFRTPAADLADVQGAQARREARGLPRRVAQLLRRRRFIHTAPSVFWFLLGLIADTILKALL